MVDDKCLDLADTSTVQFQCNDYKNGSYKSCIPECKNVGDGEYVFLESVPNRINCGPSGVYDPSKPTQSFQISECGSKDYYCSSSHLIIHLKFFLYVRLSATLCVD